MRKEQSTTLGHALPWGLIGMLGLLLAVEKVVVRHDPDLTGIVPLNWRFARNKAVSEARKCEILCLGSSIVKFGICPSLIEAETGKPTFNLAMCGASLPANYFVLRRAIEAGARPVAVLIDCLDDGNEPFQVHANLRNYPELLKAAEVLDIAWQARDSDFLAAMILSRLFSSFKNRFEIRGEVLASFRGERASSFDSGRLARRNWEANRGTWVIPRNLEYEARHRGESVQTLPEVPSPATRGKISLRGTYTSRFLDLAAAHGIQVFYLLPPLPPHTQESWNRSGNDVALTRHAIDFQACYPTLIVIEGRRSAYAVGAFHDDVHLNADGATSWTLEVAQVLKGYLPRSNPEHVWVTLPPYREQRSDPRLEDVSQTGLALRTAGARRR